MGVCGWTCVGCARGIARGDPVAMVGDGAAAIININELVKYSISEKINDKTYVTTT